jgi:hypothetical protein
VRTGWGTPYMARERVESLGADRIRVRTWSACADGRAWTVGARSKHNIGRTTATFCDHLQQICTIQYIWNKKIVITCNRFTRYTAFWKASYIIVENITVPPYMVSTHKVHANSIKDYIETMMDLTSMPCYRYSFVVGVERRQPDLRRVLLSRPRGCRM